MLTSNDPAAPWAETRCAFWVPCHRVVGAGGKLTGYAGGLARKRFLLGLEAQVFQRADHLF